MNNPSSCINTNLFRLFCLPTSLTQQITTPIPYPGVRGAHLPFPLKSVLPWLEWCGVQGQRRTQVVEQTRACRAASQLHWSSHALAPPKFPSSLNPSSKKALGIVKYVTSLAPCKMHFRALGYKCMFFIFSLKNLSCPGQTQWLA